MNNENVHSFMAHLNVLAYSTFKFVNSRCYDRARHAGKKSAVRLITPGNEVDLHVNPKVIGSGHT